MIITKRIMLRTRMKVRFLDMAFGFKRYIGGALRVLGAPADAYRCVQLAAERYFWVGGGAFWGAGGPFPPAATRGKAVFFGWGMVLFPVGSIAPAVKGDFGGDQFGGK